MKPFGEMVGLVVKFQQGQPANQIEMLKELRVRWVRDFILWHDIERSFLVYEPFSAEFTSRLDYYKANGVGLIALLTLENQKAYPDSPFNPWFFGCFAAAMAKRLKAHGVEFVIELGNEPHNVRNLLKMGGLWWGPADRLPNSKPAKWVEHYTHMCRGAVQQIRALDPNIRVMSNDDMWLIKYWMLEAQLPANLSALSVHPYTGIGPPEISAAETANPDYRPFVVTDPDRSFASCVRKLREQGAKKLAKAPEIWITEWGWNAQSISDQAIGDYLQRAFILAYVSGVDVLAWFSSHDGPDGPMGLIRWDGTKRTSYAAFKRVVDELYDYTLTTTMYYATKGPNVYVLDGHRGRKIVAWNSDVTDRTLEVGPKTYVLNQTPIYIETTFGLDEIVLV